jgi:hypothetical protein
MRMLAKVTVEVGKGNEAISSGNMGKVIGTFMERAKPEAAYFTSYQGKRTGFFVVDLKDSSQLPPLFEDFFHKLNADIEFTPVMNSDELKAGLGANASQK